MFQDSFLFAFGLTIFAGLSTGIGSCMAFFSKKFNPKFLSGSLGFSAGVMIYISFVEIFAESKAAFVEVYGTKIGYCYAVFYFFAGIVIIGIIDKLVPTYENPHEMKWFGDKDYKNDFNNLKRMGIFSALAIGLHNLPEGLATFYGAYHDPVLGISIAVAIAIHNIPEGIAVAVPIYYATKSKKKAFYFSFLSGLFEPIGALIGFFILKDIFTKQVFGIVFAIVAGIMVYISLDELLPAAERYGEHHIAIYSLIGGMAVMAFTLLLFA